MKTGTITFHVPNNNGSFLQAYALQQVLINELRIENEIIDFCSNQQERQYSLFRKPRSLSDLGRNLISLAHYFGLKRRKEKFESIRKANLKLTKRCSTPEEVYKLANAFDIMICGSDQIWNTEARDYSDVYFMQLFEKKKISYAASFGSHVEQIDHTKIKNMLSDFSNISLRERAGKELLDRIIPYTDSTVVCDPTMLLQERHYEKLMRPVYGIKLPFIFLYTINYDESILALAKRLSKKLNMPVYAPFTGYSCIKCMNYGINVFYDIGPGEFLWLMKHAAYTCSNSFHGIVFSIILKKTFFSVAGVDKLGNTLRDDRIDSLLGVLKLNNRKIDDEDLDDDRILAPIDYSYVDESLVLLRRAGIDYLKKSLSA